MNITLNELEPEKTHCFFETVNAVGGVAQTAALNSLQDDFLTSFGNLFTGKPAPARSQLTVGVVSYNFLMLVIGGLLNY